MESENKGVAVSSIRAAFSNWWSVIGIIAASVTAFNILHKIASIGLARVFSDILTIYQQWIHWPVRWFFDLIKVPTPPSWAIDLAVLWLLVGGIVLRSAWSIRAATLSSASSTVHYESTIDALFARRPFLPFFVLYCILFWPHVAAVMMSKPHVQSRRLRENADETSIFPTRNPFRNKRFSYLFDARIVLTVQALAAIACISTWVVLNIVMKIYE